MSAALRNLLETMREHPAFPELLSSVEAPIVKSFKPSEKSDEQTADWIFRSGRRLQHEVWRQFLTNGGPSQQEKS